MLEGEPTIVHHKFDLLLVSFVIMLFVNLVRRNWGGTGTMSLCICEDEVLSEVGSMVLYLCARIFFLSSFCVLEFKVFHYEEALEFMVFHYEK